MQETLPLWTEATDTALAELSTGQAAVQQVAKRRLGLGIASSGRISSNSIAERNRGTVSRGFLFIKR